MVDSFCEYLLQLWPDTSEVKTLRWTCIANVVLNSFLCYTAVMLNAITIHGIRKTSFLPTPLKTLLLSLAVSDVGVGIFAQPLFTSVYVKLLAQHSPGCPFYKTVYALSVLFCMASLSGVAAISLDRFLAIHLHLRYHELVTYTHVLVVVIFNWMLSAFVSLMWFWVPLHIAYPLINIPSILFHLVSAMACITIYLAVRRHRNQIHSLQVQHEEQRPRELVNTSGLRKSAVGVFYVYVAYLICYLPSSFCYIVVALNGPSILLKVFISFSNSLVFLNSTLNPILYCWKMRHIRHSIMNMLRNTLAVFRNSLSLEE